MKRSILGFVIVTSSLFWACSQSHTEQQLDPRFPAEQQLDQNVPTNPPSDAIPDGNAANAEVGGTPVAPKITKPVTACKDGGAFQDDLCSCGELTNAPHVASQWVCFGDFLRCLRYKGCDFQDVAYPTFTEIHPNGVYCGQDRSPEKVDGFVCTADVDLQLYMLSADIETKDTESRLGLWRFTGLGEHEFDFSSRREYWQCAQEECDCHGVKIGKSDICTETKVLTTFANPDLPFLDKEDNDCKGMVYPALSHQFYYDCNCGRWVCIGKNCECPNSVKDGVLKYKTIHLGDICDMQPIVRSLKMTVPENINSQNGTKCENGKCICNSSIHGDSADDAAPYLNNPKCYCGQTIIGPSSNEGNGGCYSAHSEELTVYCLKDAADFSDDDEFDSNTELYTVKIDSHVTESDVMCDDESEDDDTGETEELAEGESEEDVSSADEPIPQTDEALPSTNTDDASPSSVPGELATAIVANTVSEPEDIERDIYDDIRFWYDDKFKICMNYSGCTCADAICPMSTACVEGKCVDPLTGHVLNHGGFISTVQCADESACGCSSSCGKNEWCVAGKCYSELFSVIYQDKRLLYNPFSILYRFKYGHGYRYSNYEQQYKSDELREYDFGKVSPDVMSKMANGYGYTDHLAYHGECCDGDHTFTVSDLRCVRSMGCPCGSSTCGMGGLCKEDKCIYDTHYLNMMCYPNSFAYYDSYIRDYVPDDYVDYYDFDDIDPPFFGSLRVDASGNCLCNRTMLAPELINSHREQYVCDDYGWVCTDKNGCKCGDDTCDYKALCIKPGLCTAPFNSYQGISWASKNREPLVNCASEISDANNECCDSGVLDKIGNCCASGVVGTTGYCCPSEHVDNSGVCACIPDVSGQCCFSPVLDKAGYCCPEQYVTETGQCTCMDEWTGRCCIKGLLSPSGSCLLGFQNLKSVKTAPWLCEYGETEKKQGVLDKSGNCCEGVLINDFECCASGVVISGNAKSRCCDSGTYDAFGTCCSVGGVLDKEGRCCNSGEFDKDGVCCPYGVESGVCKCKSGVRHSSGQCCPEGFVVNSDNGKKCTCAAMDKNGECCESGVLSKTGYCCPGNDVDPQTGACRHSIDRFGDKHSLSSVFTNDGYYCKSGILLNDGEACCQKEDVQNGRCLCSVYSGHECCENGIKDKKGDCCPTGVLSESGYCCPKRHVGSNGQCLCLIEPETQQCAEVLNYSDHSCERGVLGVGRTCCYYGSKDKFGNCCDKYGVSNGYCFGYE